MYANQQLRAVTLETFFQGRIGYRDAASRVQRNVDGRLPHLFVPNAKPDQALDLQPYQLRDRADQPKEALALASNQVSYVSFDYPGHDAFLGAALSMLPDALSEYGVTELLRVIYRYENELIVGRDERDVIPLHKILRVPSIPWWQGDCLTEVSTSWTQIAPRGRLAIRIAAEEREVEKLLISVVSVVIPGGPVSDLPAFAGHAHAAAREWFEGAITDDFREYIKGESHV